MPGDNRDLKELDVKKRREKEHRDHREHREDWERERGGCGVGVKAVKFRPHWDVKIW